MILRLGEEQNSFNIFKIMKFSIESDNCFQIDVIEMVVQEHFYYITVRCIRGMHYTFLIYSSHNNSLKIEACVWFLETNPLYTRKCHFEELQTDPAMPLLSIQHLSSWNSSNYYLISDKLIWRVLYTLVVISNSVSKAVEERLLLVSQR